MKSRGEVQYPLEARGGGVVLVMQLDLEKEKLQKASSQAWGMSRVDVPVEDQLCVQIGGLPSSPVANSS